MEDKLGRSFRIKEGEIMGTTDGKINHHDRR
ncbi:CopK family periplasmic copper-binding protein [Polaromonas sp.]